VELTVADTGTALDIRYADRPLVRYVYRPDDVQLESPRPYWHPVYTLDGDPVSLFRPHDHVWHKGIAWSLPHVGSENFWGGVTYTRDRGYVQLPNNGATVHRDFTRLAVDRGVGVAHTLDWLTEKGELWFTEDRSFTVSLATGAWVLMFDTRMTNVSGQEIAIGSPTTHGRDNAGYGGLFWRGPRSFTGGTVIAPGVTGGDELMGIRADWMGFTGRHDEHGRSSTVLFVDAPDNPGRQTQWFVRSEPYACICPAPFFSAEVPVAPDATLHLRYAVVVADGDPGQDGAQSLADAGLAALTSWR